MYFVTPRALFGEVMLSALDSQHSSGFPVSSNHPIPVAVLTNDSWPVAIQIHRYLDYLREKKLRQQQESLTPGDETPCAENM